MRFLLELSSSLEPYIWSKFQIYHRPHWELHLKYLHFFWHVEQIHKKGCYRNLIGLMEVSPQLFEIFKWCICHSILRKMILKCLQQYGESGWLFGDCSFEFESLFEGWWLVPPPHLHVRQGVLLHGYLLRLHPCRHPWLHLARCFPIRFTRFQLLPPWAPGRQHDPYN